jgi:hypothetical protein
MVYYVPVKPVVLMVTQTLLIQISLDTEMHASC